MKNNRHKVFRATLQVQLKNLCHLHNLRLLKKVANQENRIIGILMSLHPIKIPDYNIFKIPDIIISVGQYHLGCRFIAGVYY